MEPYVKTRWTPDGLMEITVDVDTARAIHHGLRLDQVPVLKQVRGAMAHTLQVKEG